MTFDELIITHDSGGTNMDASQTLRDTVAAVRAHAERVGKAAGSVSVQFAFAATGEGRVEITAKVSAKTPAPPKATETRWIDKSGALVASDPRQTKLDLKAVGRGEQSLRTVPPRD